MLFSEGIALLIGLGTVISGIATAVWAVSKFIKRFDNLEKNIKTDKEEQEKSITSHTDQILKKVEEQNQEIQEIKKSLHNLKVEISFNSFVLKSFNLKENKGWWRSDSSGATILVSEKLQNLVKQPEANLMEYSWMNFIHKDDRHRVAEAIKYAVINKQDFNEDFRWRLTGNKYIPVNGRSYPIEIDDKIEAYYGVITDLSIYGNTNKTSTIKA